jgi:hypothetical protein
MRLQITDEIGKVLYRASTFTPKEISRLMTRLNNAAVAYSEQEKRAQEAGNLDEARQANENWQKATDAFCALYDIQKTFPQ